MVLTRQNAGNLHGIGATRVSTQVFCRGSGSWHSKMLDWLTSCLFNSSSSWGNGWPAWSGIMRLDSKVRMVPMLSMVRMVRTPPP
jgi:hypothetical protein